MRRTRVRQGGWENRRRTRGRGRGVWGGRENKGGKGGEGKREGGCRTFVF